MTVIDTDRSTGPCLCRSGYTLSKEDGYCILNNSTEVEKNLENCEGAAPYSSFVFALVFCILEAVAIGLMIAYYFYYRRKAIFTESQILKKGRLDTERDGILNRRTEENAPVTPALMISD